MNNTFMTDMKNVTCNFIEMKAKQQCFLLEQLLMAELNLFQIF